MQPEDDPHSPHWQRPFLWEIFQTQTQQKVTFVAMGQNIPLGGKGIKSLNIAPITCLDSAKV